MNLTGVTCSVDRLTLLLKVPKLCVFDMNSTDKEKAMRLDAVTKFNTMMFTKFSHLLKPDVTQGEKTELYLRHYRLIDNIDLQVSPRFPVRVRIDDDGYIKAYGNGLDEKRGYIDEYYDPEFCVRLEYNPNKSDLRKISALLECFKEYFDLPSNEFIKVSRLDIAIDYPYNLNPTLIYARGLRKGFLAYGPNGIQTVYFGSRQSACYFRIYDKKEELLHNDKVSWSRYERLKLEYDFLESMAKGSGNEPVKPASLNLSLHLWRVELEYKEPFFLGVSPEKIWHQFDRLNFFFGGKKTGDWKLDLILFVASQFQIKGVLSMLPKNTRSRYYEKLCSFLDRSIDRPSDVFNRQFPAVWKTETDKILYAFGYTGNALV